MTEKAQTSHFIHEIIDADLLAGKNDGQVVTRFPPEPNGYLHIGHAKAICLNFSTAKKYGGRCHLRFDDTDPSKEEQTFVDAITKDVHWLGFDCSERLYYASDYFQQMYDYAVALIRKEKAYVCDLSVEEFKVCRGVPTRPGKESPNRNRPVDENLRLFEEMRDGKHPDGSLVLRARIDMASPNLHLRDPAMYRIQHAHHHRTGNTWCVYPMYDWAHGLEDSIEGITHSLCTLEFEVHRPLYDWFLNQLDVHHPQQIEFARLNVSYLLTSKRKVNKLIDDGFVRGLDDPRLATLAGLRRRGYPAEAIRNFCDEVGITKYDSLTDIALLEHHVRSVLNITASRRLAVLRPLKVILTNLDEAKTFSAANNPEDEAAGQREVVLSPELYIEQTDFMEDPPKKYFRLGPGRSVRLRYAGFITCDEVVKDPVTGELVEVHCRWEPPEAAVKVKGTIHWVSCDTALPVDVRLYEHLFTSETPGDEENYEDHIRPNSLETVHAFAEPALAGAGLAEGVQFERLGYFARDSDSSDDRLVFNRTVALKSAWKGKR